jgi:flagellar basal-body rod modification protein FlgD
MDITSLTGASSAATVSKDKLGFAGLTADDFMKLLITELQNQDPTEPLGNEELLSQLSAMRSLQSNIEMGEALKSVTTNQQLATATNFIGKAITGSTEQLQSVTGVVDRAFTREGRAFVGVAGQEVPLESVTDVVAV